MGEVNVLKFEGCEMCPHATRAVLKRVVKRVVRLHGAVAVYDTHRQCV